MPLFGGSKRPPLDGLTRDEEKRRDELNEALTQRTAGKEGASVGLAVLEVLREKSASDTSEFLWPLLLGWQLMSMRHFTDAIDSFKEAMGRDSHEVRSYCGAGNAYRQAGQAAQSLGAGVTEEMVPPNMSAEDLYHEAERCFQSAIGLTKDKAELEKLRGSQNEVALALVRSAKRQ